MRASFDERGTPRQYVAENRRLWGALLSSLRARAPMARCAASTCLVHVVLPALFERALRAVEAEVREAERAAGRFEVM